MTHLTEEMLADFSGVHAQAQTHRREPQFEIAHSLRSFAAAGRTPIVDAPAWDPDEEIA
ncbi:hypothetical protein HK107_01575 [Parvularcula sp. ZS-1/3]|uniref:Uncharacterized protein n=1 Tax=Parvularcula mediterranea TaxID=2732508 RepID=A0A7Y3RJ35_9PROT|nr:hypothetical protein [Parvularcula mediterranea]NNU15013.1 hypothetical protein [Parvularcula mediterranea]